MKTEPTPLTRSNLNDRDHRGYSPLMLAVYRGQLEAAQELIALGADPNSADYAGNTILMGAAFKGHIELVQMLLAAGADSKVQNSAGLTALDFATTFGREPVVEILAGQSQNVWIRIKNFVRILRCLKKS